MYRKIKNQHQNVAIIVVFMLSHFIDNRSIGTMVYMYWVENQIRQPCNSNNALDLGSPALFEFQALGVWLSTRYNMAPPNLFLYSTEVMAKRLFLFLDL